MPGRRLGNCGSSAKLGFLPTITHRSPWNCPACALLRPCGRDFQKSHPANAAQGLQQPFRFALHDYVQHVLPVVSIHNLSQHSPTGLLRRHRVREGQAVEQQGL